MVTRIHTPVHDLNQVTRDYAENLRKVLTYNFVVKVHNRNKPVIHFEWNSSMKEFYNSMENNVFLPPVLYRPPLYQKDFHPARKFGAVGSIIDHQLTHWMDTLGSRIHADGNHRKWWIKSPEEGDYATQADLMKDQYTDFEVTGEDQQPIGKVNGTLTLDENIADNAGVSMAWDNYRSFMQHLSEKDKQAYDKWISKFPPPVADKMFFIAFGQSMCSKTREQTMKEQLSSSLTAPAKWRVNGVVKNSQDFAITFECPDETPMNPKKKCEIW